MQPPRQRPSRLPSALKEASTVPQASQARMLVLRLHVHLSALCGMRPNKRQDALL